MRSCVCEFSKKDIERKRRECACVYEEGKKSGEE